MEIDIKELAKTVAESLNLKDFKGDIVGVKVVENEFGNIEPGGIGIQINHNKDDQEEEEEEDPCGSDDLISKLKPLFFNNENEVKLFLKEIKGMKQNDITDLVNKWVSDKRISDYGNSRKGDLWTILYDVGLYTKSRQNWCRRVF